MCGITGFILNNSKDNIFMENAIESMVSSLGHRGPDDSGSWFDLSNKVILGHTRLAIQDLSVNGSQPMHSSSSRFVIAFNGEIYNHFNIRNNLQNSLARKLPWKGSSDTETILAAIENWGLQKSLEMARGMFAFAIFDKVKKKLFLVRDRFGEKPLYYGLVNSNFVFGSELKAVKAFPQFDNQVNRSALAEYLRYGYIPSPLSIYDGINKLQPGHIIEIEIHDNQFSIKKPKKYWGLENIVPKEKDDLYTDEIEALDSLESALKSSIQEQMISDVPLGAFLSGGVDSSSIVALMQENRTDRVKTFTVGFEEDEFDESMHASQIANHLNTDHTEFKLSSVEAQAVIPSIPEIYDEPFSDSSQIPTYLISQIARQKVTVSLSGDAGDEIFGGYNRYLWAPKIWSQITYIPNQMRPAISSLINSAPKGIWSGLEKVINSFNIGAGIEELDIKASKISSALLCSSTEEDFYQSFLTKWPNPHEVIKDLKECEHLNSKSNFSSLYKKNNGDFVSSEDFVSRMMSTDITHYLPDDILCKVDRAAMAASLETRVPFLDHRVAEIAWRLPFPMKIRGSETKWALRQILYKRVPRELIERPKTGFSVPIGEWLRGPLRDWAEDLLDQKRIESEGFFNPQPIQDVWNQHLSRRFDWTDKIWSILMFQLWLRKN